MKPLDPKKNANLIREHVGVSIGAEAVMKRAEIVLARVMNDSSPAAIAECSRMMAELDAAEAAIAGLRSRWREFWEACGHGSAS